MTDQLVAQPAVIDRGLLVSQIDDRYSAIITPHFIEISYKNWILNITVFPSSNIQRLSFNKPQCLV